MIEHTKESLLEAWEARPAEIKSATQTSDPVLLAGAYIRWASGDVKKALHTLQVHASGQYIDMPRFSGCDGAVDILKAMMP